MLRKDAWERMSEALAAAREGRGSVVLLTGPAGIGKSALMRAARSRAADADMTVLAAAGRHDERGFRFGVALQLLESRLDEERARLLSPAKARRKAGFDALHELYRGCAELAAAAPLAVLVDDAELADPESARFLVHLARRVDELPIALVIATGSAPEGELAELAGHGLCQLEPLSMRGTAERVTARWPEVTEEACREIHARSGGVPLIVDALAAERAQANGEAATALARWALGRAGRLHDEAPALLQAAAALGPGCRIRHAASLAGLELETAARVADRLADGGVLRPGEPLAFEQPALAEAIEASRAPGERSAAHLRAARLLRDEGASPEAVAAHLIEGTTSASEWVVDALSEAASLALARGAPSTAVRYLRRALDEPPSAGQRPQVVLALGHAEALAGEPQAVDRLSEGAAEYADEIQQEPAAALQTGRALVALGETDQAIEVFERAVEDADLAAEPAGLLRADQLAAQWLTGLAAGGRVPGAPPERADSPGERALLAVHAIDGAVRGADCREVRKLARRALADGALLEDETADGLAFYLAAAALAIAEDLYGAEAALTAAVDDAQSRGSVLGLATASAVRALTVLLAGRVPDAARDARNGIAAERDGWRIALGDARAVLAHALMETGDAAGAERQLELAEAAISDGHPSRVALLTARGRLRLLNGAADAALADFLAAGALTGRASAVNPAISPWRSGAGVAAAALGDATEGERLIEEELALAESFAAPGPVGRALRALASVRAPQAALEALEAAVEALEESQAALERARALVDFGAALRRAGRRREARSPLRAGLELAERCGADVLGVRALRELTAAGARPRRTALTGPSALTVRERQVASLAADGLSNREIAETLVVTVKTVEWHLKHSYRKLGVDSRRRLREFFPASSPPR